MNLHLAFAFGGLGVLAGVLYTALALAALKHLAPAAREHPGVAWKLWWWLEAERFDAEGQRLCRSGGWVFALGTVCWLLALYFWKQ